MVHIGSCVRGWCGALGPCPPEFGSRSDLVATDVAPREVTVHRGVYKCKVLVSEHLIAVIISYKIVHPLITI